VEKPVKEKNEKSTKKRNRLTFVDVMVPAVSGVIFLLVLFAVLIPSIENTQEMLLEIEKLEKKEETLQRNLNLIESIHFVDLQKDLANARQVIPQKLEVAQFVYYIDTLAREKKLEFQELKGGDIGVGGEEVTFLSVKGIRVPMGYRGKYEPILEFFDELQLASPYVLSFGHKVELNKLKAEEGVEPNWSLEINVTGYHVQEEEDLNAIFNPMMPFTPYDTEADLVLEFAERVKKL
jgi:hypothetical protein